MYQLFIIIVGICILISCKEDGAGNGNNPAEVEISQGRLSTLTHGIFRTCLASDDWQNMQYGFDAIADQSVAYVSIENGNKNNTFLLLAAPNNIDLYTIQPVSNTVTLARGTPFTIQDPNNPNLKISAVRYTITSGSTTGSLQLKVFRRVQSMKDGSYSEIDLEKLEGEDVSFWGFASQPAAFKKPITMHAKIYNKRTLPTINAYKLYGTKADISNSANDINKILAQAVTAIDEVKLAATWQYADKNWDLNGNGKLDIDCNDPPGDVDEFDEIMEWASVKGVWGSNIIGAIILEQEFELHNSDGTLIKGLSSENFIVLPGTIDNRLFCHEYMHCTLAGDLRDNVDEYNIMYYMEDFGQNRLRYRPATLIVGGTEKQWEILSQQTF